MNFKKIIAWAKVAGLVVLTGSALLVLAVFGSPAQEPKTVNVSGKVVKLLIPDPKKPSVIVTLDSSGNPTEFRTTLTDMEAAGIKLGSLQSFVLSSDTRELVVSKDNTGKSR